MNDISPIAEETLDDICSLDCFTWSVIALNQVVEMAVAELEREQFVSVTDIKGWKVIAATESGRRFNTAWRKRHAAIIRYTEGWHHV